MTPNKTAARLRQALQPLGAAAFNLCGVLIVYTLLRLLFFEANRAFFPAVTAGEFARLCLYGLRFDLTSVLYLSLPYLLMALLPLPQRQGRAYNGVAKGLYLAGAGLGVFANLCDVAYFPFTLQRTTVTFFREFKGDGHVGDVILKGMAGYWYLTLFFAAAMVALYFLYRPLRGGRDGLSAKTYALAHGVTLLVSLLLIVFGIRGLRVKGSPLGLSDADLYCPVSERPIVFNTPFTLIRTLDSVERRTLERVSYYPSEAALEAEFTPVQRVSPAGPPRTDNVVILLLESFSKEFTGYFNPKNKENRGGYTPFLDSLLEAGYTFRYSFADGKKSVESIPAVLAGVPMAVNLQDTKPFATGRMESLATHLRRHGYRTSFFHNSSRRTLGICGFVLNLGVEEYFGLEDYPDQSQFDGTWGIWDEEFLDYMAQHLDTLPQPFMSGIFTTTSHHPFRVPERYEGVYPEGPRPMHHCIAYTDDALRKFFGRVRHAEWYPNTLFVILADHTSELSEPTSMNPRGYYEIPILFYHPSDPALHGLDTARVAQQTDILPSVLGYLGMPDTCVAWGGNLFDKERQTFAFNYMAPVWQLYQDSLLLQFDGEKTVGLYNYRSDTYMERDLKGKHPAEAAMERKIKALVQQYMNRVLDNRLTAE